MEEHITEEHITEQIKAYNQFIKEQDDFYHRASQWAGLSDAAQWVLYRLCGENRELYQSDLCKEWFFSKQTINSAVGKLVEDEYVVLHVIQGAGNRKKLGLTEKGKEFCSVYIVPILAAERKTFEIFTEEERITLLRLMKKQSETLNQEAEKLWQ